MLEQINSFLSSLPWWAVVGMTLVVVLPFRFATKAGIQGRTSEMTPGRDSVGARPVTTSVQSLKVELSGDDARQFESMLRSGNKINAIKLLRSRQKLDLLDAKNIVDALQEHYREKA